MLDTIFAISFLDHVPIVNVSVTKPLKLMVSYNLYYVKLSSVAVRTI